MWTDRSGGDPLTLASKVPVPLEDSWTENERARALQHLFAEIATKLPTYRPAARQNPRSKVFAFELLKTQYYLLYREKQSKKAECVSFSFFGP
jgi:hypothetical protein